MENQTEVLETQIIPEVTAPTAEEETLTAEQIADLKHKATVSSQNFERAKKAENEVKELRAQLEVLAINEVPSEDLDENALKFKAELSEIKEKLAKSEVLEAHPELKELWNDFESFREEPENKGLQLKTAAKVFLTEKGILEPKRKGLEKPTGGPKMPLSSGMNHEELKKLRETDHRKYRDMLKKGQIKF